MCVCVHLPRTRTLLSHKTQDKRIALCRQRGLWLLCFDDINDDYDLDIVVIIFISHRALQHGVQFFATYLCNYKRVWISVAADHRFPAFVNNVPHKNECRFKPQKQLTDQFNKSMQITLRYHFDLTLDPIGDYSHTHTYILSFSYTHPLTNLHT